MRPVFVLCEGIHDIALISALLTQSGYPRFEKKLNEYPPIISGLIASQYNKRPVGDARCRSQDLPLMDTSPVFACAHAAEDVLFLFFIAKGDTANANIKSFFASLIDISGTNNPLDLRLDPFGIVFVRDADDSPSSTKLEGIINDYSDSIAGILPNFRECTLESAIWHENYSASVIIFTKTGTDRGALEDLLEPQLAEYFGSRWQDATAFLGTHCDHLTKLKPTSSTSKRLKAIIAIAGQPDQPGCSQAVIMREAINKNVEALLRLDFYQSIIDRLRRTSKRIE